MKYYLDVLKNYANFNGRARRKEYWMFFLFHMIILYGTLFLTTIVPELIYVYAIYLLGTIIPSIAVGVRRMHDVGKSGWYLLIPIYSFILAVTNGEEGENEYGADPKGNGDEIGQIGVSQN